MERILVLETGEPREKVWQSKGGSIAEKGSSRSTDVEKGKDPNDVLYVLLKKNKIFRKDSIKIEYSKGKKNEEYKDIGEGNKAENKTG